LVIVTARDPTSHNLWPFEIIMCGALSVVVMFVPNIAHRFARSSAQAQPRVRCRATNGMAAAQCQCHNRLRQRAGPACAVIASARQRVERTNDNRGGGSS
jgi:hypothetical protein